MNRDARDMRDLLVDYYTAYGKNTKGEALAFMQADEAAAQRGFDTLARKMMRENEFVLQGTSYLLTFAWPAARAWIADPDCA